MAADKPVSVELEANEFALIVGEEDGEMSVRVVGGAEISDDAPEMPAPAEIILALASVGRQIGASLVAEGIEQEEDLRVLVELGIPYGQGFLLGRPSAKVPTPRRHAQTPRRAGPP